MDYCNKNFFSCYSSMEDYYKDPVNARYLETWQNHEMDATGNNEKISDYKAFKSSINKNNSNLDEIHKISVNFTPIYIDLNDNKEVGDDELIYCFNPALDKKYREAWINGSDKYKKKYFNNGLLMDKVCKKYAKF